MGIWIRSIISIVLLLFMAHVVLMIRLMLVRVLQVILLLVSKLMI